MQVREIMTTDVVTIGPTRSAKEAARALIDRHISGMPVIDEEGFVVGMITEGDILHHESLRHPATSLASFFKSVEEPPRTVEDVMSEKVRTIWPDAEHTEAARIMETAGVKRLPVTVAGRIVGIVSRADVIKVFARSDEEIAAEIRDEVLGGVLWLDNAEVEVDVSDGNVTLSGTVPARSDLRILEELSRRIDGVISVDVRGVDYLSDDARRAQLPLSGNLPRSNW